MSHYTTLDSFPCIVYSFILKHLSKDLALDEDLSFQNKLIISLGSYSAYVMWFSSYKPGLNVQNTLVKILLNSVNAGSAYTGKLYMQTYGQTQVDAIRIM